MDRLLKNGLRGAVETGDKRGCVIRHHGRLYRKAARCDDATVGFANQSHVHADTQCHGVEWVVRSLRRGGWSVPLCRWARVGPRCGELCRGVHNKRSCWGETKDRGERMTSRLALFTTTQAGTVTQCGEDDSVYGSPVPGTKRLIASKGEVGHKGLIIAKNYTAPSNSHTPNTSVHAKNHFF